MPIPRRGLFFPTLFLVKWQLNINSHKYNVIICSIVHKNMNAPTVVLCWLMIGQPIESLVYWLNTITSQSRVHGSYRKQLNNLKQSETVHCKRQWCEDVGSALLTTDFKCSLFCSLELWQIKLCNCNHIVRFMCDQNNYFKIHYHIYIACCRTCIRRWWLNHRCLCWVRPCMFLVSRGGKSTDILYLEVQEEVQILVLKTTPVNVQVLIQFLYSKVKMYKLSNVIKVRK